MTADIPYGGCGVTASAAAMDKIISKEPFIRAGIPRCVRMFLRLLEELEEVLNGVVLLRIEREFGYPVYVEPGKPGLQRRHFQSV